MIKIYVNIAEAIIDMGDSAEQQFKKVYDQYGHNERSTDCILTGSFIHPAPVEPVETQVNYGQYFIDNCVDQLWYSDGKGELEYVWLDDSDEMLSIIQEYFNI
jgi:hypothetical protein